MPEMDLHFDKLELVNRIYDEIKKASVVLKNIVHNTPLDYSSTISKMTGGKIYLKLENLQKTGSFKVRGAYYKISKLLKEGKTVHGVITASAGNHAQGVAFAASKANVKAKIVMPIFTPLAKVLATQGYGAEIILYGKTFDEANEFAHELAEKEGFEYIPPFDDPEIIAGQGTIGLEILSEMKPDFIFVPIGGGGLISGISVAVKKNLGGNCKIIGVQSEAFPSAYSLLKGEEVKSGGNTIAEGIAVKRLGKLTGKIIRELVDDILLVSDDYISRAIFILLERGKTLAEGAGAASVAALLSRKINIEGKKVVAVVSGGNLNMTLLTKIVRRELVRLKRIIKLKARLPDIPGTLSKVLSMLAKENINVVDISSERYDPRIPPSESEITIVVEVKENKVLRKLLDKMQSIGFNFEIEE